VRPGADEAGLTRVRRPLDEALRRFVGRFEGGSPEQERLRQARELVHSARAAGDPAERVAIGRGALKIAPGCADAYLLLAGESLDRKEAHRLWEQAVDAAERDLGPDAFEEYACRFWAVHETRPYLRARAGLAQGLWNLGRRDEAIRHAQELIRLDPGDHLGVRHPLGGWLLVQKRDRELGHLLRQFPEDTAEWAYNRALLAFRHQGDTQVARRRLQRASDRNPDVLDYLQDWNPLPARRPGPHARTAADEAILYAIRALAGWKRTPGAIAWVNREFPPQEPFEHGRPAPFGPLPGDKRILAGLPQGSDVWQMENRRETQWLSVAGCIVCPWTTLIVSPDNSRIRTIYNRNRRPSADMLWDQLALAMLRPMDGPAHRPARLQVRPDDPRWDELRPHLEELGVALVATEPLDPLDECFAFIGHDQAEAKGPPLVEIRGILPDQIAAFYRAAADYHRRAPWRRLRAPSAIRVEGDALPDGPRYAVVLGQAGLTTGLALHEDLAALTSLWARDPGDVELGSRETTALSVTFGHMARLRTVELEAGQALGWEVAGPRAYPAVTRKEEGTRLVPPLAWEVGLLEGCLRAVPEFLAQQHRDDPAPRRMTVPAAPGELRLALSWLEES
jgi:hypothetical protein